MILPENDVKNIKNFLNEHLRMDVSRFTYDNQLRYWSKYKRHFYEEWGGHFILEKQIDFEKSLEDKESAIHIYRRGTESIDYPNFDYFLRDMEDAICDYDVKNAAFSDEALAVNRLLKDVVIDEGFSFEKGMKLTRLFRKIATKYNIHGYEDFIRDYSVILNSFKISGTLCLSIHPMDFLTMGSHLNGWDTCMDLYDGEYCQGAIEMMNSPNVICAYIKHEDDIGGHTWGWNSKRWRELFIVEDEFILEIKSYPCQLPEISKMIINWLRELYPDRQYGEIQESYKRDINHNGQKIPTPNTGYMYNDFGHIPRGHYYSTIEGWVFEEAVCYSGPAICLDCGELMPPADEDTAENLSRYFRCPVCMGLDVCDCCGGYTASLNYLQNGQGYCSTCWENYTFCSDLTNESYRNEEDVIILLVPNKEITHIKNLRDVYQAHIAKIELENIEDWLPKGILFKKRITAVEKSYFCNDIHYDKEFYMIDINDLPKDRWHMFNIYLEVYAKAYISKFDEIFS